VLLGICHSSWVSAKFGEKEQINLGDPENELIFFLLNVSDLQHLFCCHLVKAVKFCVEKDYDIKVLGAIEQ